MRTLLALAIVLGLAYSAAAWRDHDWDDDDDAPRVCTTSTTTSTVAPCQARGTCETVGSTVVVFPAPRPGRKPLVSCGLAYPARDGVLTQDCRIRRPTTFWLKHYAVEPRLVP